MRSRFSTLTRLRCAGTALSRQCEPPAQALTFEEAQARRDRLARMRALLFYHELKAKRVKAIKSKEYHRRLNRAAKRKAAKAGEAGDDNEALRAAAEDAEFQRVKVRVLLSDGPMRQAVLTLSLRLFIPVRAAHRYIRQCPSRGRSGAYHKSIATSNAPW